MNNYEQENYKNTVPHLEPEVWERVNRLHIRKIISEFAHELLLTPELQSKEGDWGVYTLPISDTAITYHFRAQVLSLDHWHIETTSIEKYEEGKKVPLDSLSFIIEVKDIVGINEDILPLYMEEINSTLCGRAYVYSQKKTTSEDLVHADYQDIEHAMIEGHPCFVANNGRIGFDLVDYKKYVPEAAAPFSLLWVAGHKDNTGFTTVKGVDYEQIMSSELSEETRTAFETILHNKGVKSSDYFFIPIHPWQWHNKLAMIFAPDIANKKLVLLGYSEDKYRPQQSIRTFFNISNPTKHYVKTALSILNMGFMRGLPPSYMITTPPINDWVSEIVTNDAYLEKKGFTILRETATVGYTNTYYYNAGKDTDYNRMLSSLWRESPMTKLRSGEKLMTMAALLHIDKNGTALLPLLIRDSGLDTTNWLRKYLDAYLSPLLHCFYHHDIRFTPHGENLILIMKNNVPVRVIMKDIGEEVGFVNNDVALPEAVQQMRVPVSKELKILSIFTQIFDCYFRFLSHILVEHDNYPQEKFWELAADCITTYQQENPQLEKKFEECDLFADEIIKTCLNRLQLRNNKKMVDLSDPFKTQQFAGTFKNPLAAYKKVAL